MSLTRYEQETIINFNEEEQTANIYTYNDRLKRKLFELCESRPEDTKRLKDDGCGGITFEVPKKWIKVNAPRILSEKQKLELTERLKSISS